MVSIERELTAGTLLRPSVVDLQVRRQLKLITNPSRYCSRAAEAFRRDVLPVFASADSPLRQGRTGALPQESSSEEVGESDQN